MSSPTDIQDRIDALRSEIARAAGQGTSALNTHIILQSQAEITVLVGQLAEISTRRLIRVAWALVALTFALLIFTIALYEDAHAQIQRDKFQQQRGTNRP